MKNMRAHAVLDHGCKGRTRMFEIPSDEREKLYLLNEEKS